MDLGASSRWEDLAIRGFRLPSLHYWETPTDGASAGPLLSIAQLRGVVVELT